MTDQLIRDYYRCFNERRLVDAGALFTARALVDMPPFVQGATGAAAYAQFTDAWLRAFPDAQFMIERVDQRGDTMCEVDLRATGTHTGLLDLGTYVVLKPSGVRVTLRLRELLDIREGLITYASLPFDSNQLVRELNQIDYRKVAGCLAAVWDLADELAKAQGDVDRRRDVTERLGRALDAARQAVRPQFKP